MRSAHGTVDGVEIPKRHNPVAHYPIAVLRNGENHALAREFIRFVVSERGQGLLARFGFLAA